MGRIPLLLPLNVKPAEAAGQTPEPAARLNSFPSANARRMSYAYGGSETGSFSGLSRAKEARPSVPSGSDTLGGLAVARPDAGLLAGLLAGREARALGSPRTTSISSAASLSPSPSAHMSSDGSTCSRIGSTGRQAGLPNPFASSGAADRRPSQDGGTAAAGSVTARGATHIVTRISEATPALPSASVALPRNAPPRAPSPGVWRSAHVPTAGDPNGAARGPVPSATMAPACGIHSPLPSGMSLAQLALSTCSTAEQQLRELLSPGPASPAAGVLPTLPQSPAAAAPSSVTRRTMAPASPGSPVVAAAAPPPAGVRHSPSLTLRVDPHRLAVSACSSPVTSPVAHYGLPTGAAGRVGGGGGGGLLAALLDHRQMLGPAHPSAARPERVTRFAVDASGTGTVSGEPSEGQGAGERPEEGGAPSGFSLRPPPASALVRQLRDGQEASMSAAAAALQQMQQQQEEEAQQDAKQHNESGKTRKTGVIWANLLPGAGRDNQAGAGAAPALEPGSAAGPAAGPAAPAITAAAMRVVQELKNMDEFSLVAAARQRQQQLMARTLSKQPTSKKVGSAVGGRSIHDSRRSLCGLGWLSGGEGGGGGGSSGSISSLPHLLAAARVSCPAMQSLPDLGDVAAPLSAVRDSDICGGSSSSGTASPPRNAEAGGAGNCAAGTSAAAAATSTSKDHMGDGAGPGGGGGASGSFLPAVASPRPPAAASSSARSLASSVSVGAAGSGSRAGSSSPSGGTGQQHAASEVGSGTTAATSSGPVSEQEAAAAAVRALEARFGSAVLPDSRTACDQDELERRRKLYEALQAANPVAYHEEAAEAAEASYRALSERAQYRFRMLLQEATTQEAPLRQLEDALRELTSQRPFFLPPVISKPKVERTFVESDNKGPQQSAWNVDESIFAQRKKETESHELYDTDKVRAAQLYLDWKRVVAKARFRRMVAKGDMGVKVDGQSLEEELFEVREELERQAHFVRSAFVYYSMTSPGAGVTSSEVLQMSASAWMAFCHDAGIVGKGVTGMDVQNIFVAVNFEEESETEESAANDDDAMVRFEFMEGLVRVAFAKYINTKRMTDASDALGALLEEVVATPSFPAEARVDPNDFRRTRFYCAEVEEVIKEYWDLLVGMFKLYKARDRARYFWPEHFLAFLESNQLLGPATGLTRREAKLIFGWSQSLVTDELRRRQRAVSLTQWDFIEAVARVADTLSPPDVEEMILLFEEEGEVMPEADRLVYEYYRLIGDAGSLLRRPSAGLLGPPTRPLAPKLRQLLQYLVCTLRGAWGGNDAREVAAKVMRTATYLSGGIEMG